MCTAVTYKTESFYFGRTLDYEFSYNEEVTITPRNFCLNFRKLPPIKSHLAIIGMAYVCEDYPLYYDAANEKGLAMAGLNFVKNADYGSFSEGYFNVAQFEFIPFILSQCSSVKEACDLIKKTNIIHECFNQSLAVAQLHWLLCDKHEAVTLETKNGKIAVYNNPVGVLSNNPPFEKQLFSLNNYMHLSAAPPKKSFSDKIEFKMYSRGMGAIGLPGDLSSQSRFIRAAFVKLNSVSENDEISSVNQFFHILGSVEQQMGCCILENGEYVKTIYTSCINTDKGIYYYKTYNNSQITAVYLTKENLNQVSLIHYPLILNSIFKIQN